METKVAKTTFLQRNPIVKDGISIVGFIVAVLIGTFILNNYVFRSYNVVGGSMEGTLSPGDRIIVNRLPVTWAHLRNQHYLPPRGQIIVAENPRFLGHGPDQFIIKRVVAFEGERVVVQDGILTVYNDEFPEGFRPDEDFGGEPKTYTSGEIDVIVPRGEVFVVGDNREGSSSHDSRNGLGTIPLFDIVGPAGVRIYPFNRMRTF
ncbi:signal peptidase I [Candidatus Saccharibacteria bacterium]|nr:signal peptidase I [Candidatus Saccharibacteria bacterium]